MKFITGLSTSALAIKSSPTNDRHFGFVLLVLYLAIELPDSESYTKIAPVASANKIT